jgi:hypothetical protein
MEQAANRYAEERCGCMKVGRPYQKIVTKKELDEMLRFQPLHPANDRVLASFKMACGQYRVKVYTPTKKEWFR